MSNRVKQVSLGKCFFFEIINANALPALKHPAFLMVAGFTGSALMLGGRVTGVEKKMDKSFDKMDKKFDNMDKKLDNMDKKFDKKLDNMDKKFDKKFDKLEDKVGKVLDEIRLQTTKMVERQHPSDLALAEYPTEKKKIPSTARW